MLNEHDELLGGLSQGEHELHLEMQEHKPSSVVKLVVGQEERVFELDEQLICTYCSFFSNAFSGGFLEAQTKTLKFPDDSPERFEELTKWLAGEKFPNSEHSWKALIVMWLFADKYHIDHFQNAVINSLYQKFAAREEGINISFETLDFVVENTSQTPSSPLRRIFAEMLTNGISLQQLPKRMDQIPPELLQDMLLERTRQVSMNGPTNISLLTSPVTSFLSSSTNCKTNARPQTPPPVSTQSSDIYCDGWTCKSPQEPIRGLMHICTNHNLKLCHDCRHSHPGHRKKMLTFTTAPYISDVTGNSLVIDGQINDSGFYCDGPKCDPGNKKLTHELWALMSGDRYHCLECGNLDFCTICIRGPLPCKKAAHRLLRIRPTFARKVYLTEEINIKQRQDRVAKQVCWRCGSAEHTTMECEEKAVVAEDVAVED